MSGEQLSWQAVAVELLRRRAGAPPSMPDQQLAAAGAEHQHHLARKRIDGLYYRECNRDHPRRRLYQALWETQAAEARRAIAELERRGISAIVFKGLEIAARHDGGRATSSRMDVDLLVSPEALWEVKRALHGLGYRHGIYQPESRRWTDLDHARAARREAAGYELVPLGRIVALETADGEMLAEARRWPPMFVVEGDVALVIVELDVHHNLLFDLDLAPLIARSVPSALGVGRALSPADHLWFAIHRYYYEVGIGGIGSPRVLALIAPMVSDPEVDWEVVLGNAIGKRTAAPCFYWLTFFRRLGATAIPEKVLAELKAHLGESQRNWGWQLGRLFDIEEPFPSSLLPGH